MNFPADINQWDYSTIYTLVTQHDYEPGTYDFKEVLSGTGNEESRKKLNDSICKTICGMANTDGGYLIFGVKDPKQWPNLTERERLGGIPKSSEYVKLDFIHWLTHQENCVIFNSIKFGCHPELCVLV